MRIIVYGDIRGQNAAPPIGEPDYHSVLSRFRPVLDRLGTVSPVHDPGREVDAIFHRCRDIGEPCLFLSFTPVDGAPRGLACPTMVVFAWPNSATSAARSNRLGRGDRRAPRCDRGVALSGYPASAQPTPHKRADSPTREKARNSFPSRATFRSHQVRSSVSLIDPAQR
jgi:hypothetical protein